jgi:hypothetical protein
MHMKKTIIAIAFLFTCSFTGMAQGTISLSSPADMLEMLREKQKPALISNLKLTDEQAEKVIAIQVWAAPQLRKISFDTPIDQQPALIDQLNAEKKKKYQAIPLSDEKVTAVINFYADMLKNGSWPGGEKRSTNDK